MWKGCDWTPSDKSASEQMVLGELRVLQRRVMSMDGDLRRAEKDIEWLKRKLKSKKFEDDGQQEEREVVTKPPAKQANSTGTLIAQAWS